ncbi:N-6 DNA methylase [Macrococcoides canis]|uniref:Eco57I restriction-modification methylase domain-containing protein n=1 Tax=Macrococcoides canis TaxID=1855823 RepID=UPI0020B7E152|nr:DNA methyltransferase [Macrococcus canis]UTH09107.1 N-6 DNA methylase [Macrococcus canis]
MANIFPKNKVIENAKKISTVEILPFINILVKWKDDYHHGSLKNDKETSRTPGYYQDIFVTILGYARKPNKNYNFDSEVTMINGQRPDAVIGYHERDAQAVIEMKGAMVPLDRPQKREGNMSPVQQAFKYKPLYRHCPFVIVSNFWEFRLYHDNQLDYEVWTLEDLVDEENDYLNFKTWYYLLCSENFISVNAASKTEKLLTDIRIEQEKISKDFYYEYKEARLELLRDIWKENPDSRKDFSTIISKAQKIIDRIVFICFAEDKGLIPDNKLVEVVNAAKNSPFGYWEMFIAFFNAVDRGSEKLEIPQGYNGGLFKEDKILNNLKISDHVLERVASLSKYDFDQDLSVNILGHIFEQSISDLEEIKSAVNPEQVMQNSKRKNDGIFYTPDNIVHYIVENSLGTYLYENEERIKREYGLKEDIQDETYIKRENEAYKAYQVFLQNIKVLDPACGSGAFLVYVYDYLLAENKRVGNILENSLFSDDEYVRDILKNNIYGVDLNEESVEITRLSLWLKTAQKGKKLTTLDSNIKCGNSLIDDSAIAGNKAFNWSAEFPKVLEAGGFDVIVGNPPYVDSENMVKNIPEERKWISNNYITAAGNWDLLVPFIEKSLFLLNDLGKMSFITSNKWLSANYGSNIRKQIANNISFMCDFTDENIFESAKVSSVVFGVDKKECDKLRIDSLKEGVIDFDYEINKDVKTLEMLSNNLSSVFSKSFSIISKVFQNNQTINDYKNFNVFGAFATSEAYEMKEYILDDSNLDYEYKLINTGTIDKYVSLWGTQEFSYLKSKYLYPKLNRETLLDKFPRRYEKISKPKILTTGIRHFESFLDHENKYISTKSTVVTTGDLSDLSWLISFYNSKFIKFYIKENYYKSSMNGGINFTPDLIKSLPIPELNEETKEILSEKVYEIQRESKDKLKLKEKFVRRLLTNFEMDKPTKKYIISMNIHLKLF